jgi:hypothetical protein
MYPNPNRSHPRAERDPHDTAQPWLDFGRWLAGEISADQAAACGFVQGIPSFAGIAERHFRDLAPQAPHGNSHDLRRAMHRRFIQALQLAFGSGELDDLAAHQPPHLLRLIEHLRADFDLLPERAAAVSSSRFRTGSYPAAPGDRPLSAASSRAGQG